MNIFGDTCGGGDNSFQARMAAIPKNCRRNKGRRGSALIFALLAAAVLAASVATVSNSSFRATQSLNADDSDADSMAAAEFGADLAMADISAWSRQEGNSGKDWAYGNNGDRLYRDPMGNPAPDNRRFQGFLGDREFRVMVRSAALAKSGKTKDPTWLWTPDVGEQLYEIISTARPRDLAAVPSERRISAILNQVISFNSGKGIPQLGAMGPLFASNPRYFQPTLDENVTLSGEDHNITKYYVETFPETIISTPLKLTTSTANFMLADGSYWTGGNLTLNYRKYPDDHLETDPLVPRGANPHRPKTTAFGTSIDNRAMWAAYPNAVNHLDPDDQTKNREYDTYLLGGKAYGGGRTVTVDMDVKTGDVQGRINETSGAGVTQGGAFNLVLGQFEDLRNLYINIAGIVGSITDPRYWWQMYVGQYTHSPRPSSYPAKMISMPNYGGTRIRAQTAHLMKNIDGQVLVRLYAKTTGTGANAKKTYYKYPASETQWTGDYCWANVSYVKGGITLTKTVTASGNKPGELAGQQVVARTFFWQELVGYELVKRGDLWAPKFGNANQALTYPKEPAIITQADIPSDGSQRIDKRTMYKYDDEGARIPAGFDELYQAYDITVLGSPATNMVHPRAADYGAANAVSDGYLANRFDAIYVWNEATGEAEPKASMEDFLFEKDFSENADGSDPDLIRPALALLIGYEDLREVDADFDYTDMVFTIYIAPSSAKRIEAITLFTLLTDQWWEQDPDNGLTGKDSHPALTTNRDLSTVASEEPIKDNYELLGYTPKKDPDDPNSVSFEDRVYTMRVADDSGYEVKAGVDDMENRPFLRAVFESNTTTGLFRLVPLRKENNVEYQGPYYYTDDDVTDFCVFKWRMRKDTDPVIDYGSQEQREQFEEEFLNLITNKQGFQLVHVDERWEPEPVSRPILSGDAANTAYQVLQSVFSLRKTAADILGYRYQDVPVVETYEYQAVEDDDGRPLEPKRLPLGYLAGEMLQDPDAEDLTDVQGSVIPHKSMEVVQPDGSVTPIREFLHQDPAEAVKMAYVDYYVNDPDKRKEVEYYYGTKDQRYSIGFHRSGTDAKYDERPSRDHYEVVSLGQLGFNPFMTTKDGKVVAKNSLIDPEGPDKPVYNYEYKYDQGLAPTFVFDKPIDGAGILVVNGNLHIKDVFAYYGVLVVLGDIIVTPTYQQHRFVYGPDGDPVDAYGHSLYQNDAGRWTYQWRHPDTLELHETTYALDDYGARIKDNAGNDVPVLPLYATGADAYRGALISQGSVLVGGKMINETVENFANPGETITGEIRLYASEAATDMADSYTGVDRHQLEVKSWNKGSWSAGGEVTGNLGRLNADIERLWNGKAE
ncbi:MAG: hypothetical protein LBT97_11380 [Planctomycetota bacterium]|nr:hypothetical protein [Planctomycetota bacterium]